MKHNLHNRMIIILFLLIFTSQSTFAQKQQKADTGGCGTVIYGGKTYHSVIIGSQCWMRENLDIGNWIDRSQIQDSRTDSIIKKYCFGNNFVVCDQWGGLYQWDQAMMFSETVGAQGICPPGWHIPSSQEWYNLIEYLGGNSVAGGKMKVTGTGFWIAPNLGADNSSGFTAMPGGSYDDLSRSWRPEKTTAAFWTSQSLPKEKNKNVAVYLNFRTSSADMDEEFRTSALSVRCIHNK